MTEPKRRTLTKPHIRKPGDGFPAKTGNMKIVRKCADEILALKEEELGFDLTSICELLTKVFQHEEGVLTPKRLSDCLALVQKKDDPRRKKERTVRVAKLKGDMEQILKQLKVKSADFNKNLSSLIHPVAPVLQTQVPQAQVRPQAKPASPAPAKPAPMDMENFNPESKEAYNFTQEASDYFRTVVTATKGIMAQLKTGDNTFSADERIYFCNLFSDRERFAYWKNLEQENRSAWAKRIVCELEEFRKKEAVRKEAARAARHQ